MPDSTGLDQVRITLNGQPISGSIYTSKVGPDAFDLNQNYPNPFNNSTTIEYWIPVTSDVRIKVYDVLGRQIATIVNDERRSAGRNLENWHSDRLASGVYFYRMVAEGVNGSRFVKVKQMTLLK